MFNHSTFTHDIMLQRQNLPKQVGLTAAPSFLAPILKLSVDRRNIRFARGSCGSETASASASVSLSASSWEARLALGVDLLLKVEEILLRDALLVNACRNRYVYVADVKVDM